MLQALGLEEGLAGEAAVRRQFRQQAVLVHPDKCALPHAAEAFRTLQQAAADVAGTPVQVSCTAGCHSCGHVAAPHAQARAQPGNYWNVCNAA
jgi:hypothetical protein